MFVCREMESNGRSKERKQNNICGPFEIGGASSEPLKPLAMGLLLLQQTIRRFKNFKLYLSGFWTYGGNKEVSVGGDHGHGKISAAA